MTIKVRCSAPYARFARVDGVACAKWLLGSPSPFATFKPESIHFYATRTRAESSCDDLGNDAVWLLFYLTDKGRWCLLAESYQCVCTYPNEVMSTASLVAYYWRKLFPAGGDYDA